MQINKRLILCIGILAIIGAGITLFEIRYNPTSLIYFTAGWVLVVLILLWFGNQLITKILGRYLSWLSYGNVRFFLHLFVGIIFSLIVINVSYAGLKYLLTIDPPTRSQVIVMNVYGAILFIPAFSIYFSLHFLRSWQKSEVESEKFQKENMRSQLESLKSHLDPHFLFNNLNILSSLIEKDKARSKFFLEKFAEVYRLLLQSRKEDLITLREELDFIEPYCFLLQTRFDESIQFTFTIPESLHRLLLPPLTLQMLIENAIKHTLITEKKPLRIAINGLDHAISVSNNLNEKTEVQGIPQGSGLENIRMRYSHFSTRSIEIEKTKNDFRVTVPLLELAVQ